LIVWLIVNSIKLFTIALQDYVNVTKQMGTTVLMGLAKCVQPDLPIIE